MRQTTEPLLAGLLVAARLWAAGEPLDAKKFRAARDIALLANHARYVRLVPVYRRLAEDLDLINVADLDTLVDNLLVGVALFKSYDEQLVDLADFSALTEWLAQVSTLRPQPDLDGVTDVEDWRARLQAVRVYVGMSSGTSGRPSFVPRDAATLAALRSNGRWYSTLGWDREGDFDVLLLVPPGTALGIQAVAAGLARSASRTYRLDAGDEAGGTDEDLRTAVEFLRTCGGDGRRMIVFGAPPNVAALCAGLLERDITVNLPPRSLLVTGGGWKLNDVSDDLALSLPDLISGTLGLPPEKIIDIYGLSECNAYMIRCAEGRYHVPPILEAVVVDDTLTHLRSDDATGQIGLLDPFAFSYPGFLLTGDEGRLVRTPCGCGVAGPGFVGAIVRAPGHVAKGCAGAFASAVA